MEQCSGHQHFIRYNSDQPGLELMETQFNGAQSPASPDDAASGTAVAAYSPDNGPELLLRLTPWHRAFCQNALDLVLLRRVKPVETTSTPGEFWPDVFVSCKLPLASFRQSALYHLFLIAVLYGFSYTWQMRPHTVPTRDPFQHQTITYYSISEYLPALETPASPSSAKENIPGDPEYAKQRITSVPRNPDSHKQTIVTPPRIKLPDDINIPNMIAWTPVPTAVPMAAAEHSTQGLLAPVLAPVEPPPAIDRSAPAARLHVDTSAVGPAPTVDNAKLRASRDIQVSRAVVEPPPTIEGRIKSPSLPLASAVEAAPSLKDVRRMGEINIAAVDTLVSAPKLPVQEQRATGSLLHPQQLPSGGRSGQASAGSPPPSLRLPGNGPGGNQPVGQLLALGIRPVAPNGPIRVPEGNRTGIFAVGPEGKSGAHGTPDIKAGSADSSNGNGSGKGAGGKGGASPIEGLSVASGPSKPAAGVVVAGMPSKTASVPTTLAALMRPRMADIARATAPSPTATTPSSKIEDAVFAGKKYYSMTLNMPNLVSASGSWIIRFAELNAGAVKGELTAPVATQKVDPAYPTELMRQRVEGTVVLYAIIHADGSVADVRVLRGIDERLDQNARVALMKWHFRPGTRNGSAVDLEAVVQIPFVARQLPF